MSPAIKCLILLAVVALFFVTEIIPLAVTATAGAVACGLLGLIPAKQVFSGLSNSTVVLFAGMFVVGAAMFYTGLAQAIGNKVVHLCGTGENSLMFGLMGGSPSPMVVTAVLFALSCILTQFMSNTASAALLCPIGIAIAKQLSADPKAVIMAIAVAASCAFATPVGTPPNTLVLGPGGYKFMDYVKAGTGLVIVCFIVSLVIIPIVWPFFPGK